MHIIHRTCPRCETRHRGRKPHPTGWCVVRNLIWTCDKTPIEHFLSSGLDEDDCWERYPSYCGDMAARPACGPGKVGDGARGPRQVSNRQWAPDGAASASLLAGSQSPTVRSPLRHDRRATTGSRRIAGAGGAQSRGRRCRPPEVNRSSPYPRQYPEEEQEGTRLRPKSRERAECPSAAWLKIDGKSVRRKRGKSDKRAVSEATAITKEGGPEEASSHYMRVGCEGDDIMVAPWGPKPQACFATCAVCRSPRNTVR